MTNPAGSGAAERTAEHAARIWERAMSVPPKHSAAWGCYGPSTAPSIYNHRSYEQGEISTGFMLMSPLIQQPWHRSASTKEVSPTHLWCQAPPVGKRPVIPAGVTFPRCQLSLQDFPGQSHLLCIHPQLKRNIVAMIAFL